MGIRGLMSFVEDHSNEFFTDVKLRDTKLIIDGYALFHRLCFNSHLELRYGGDYDSFADVAQKFFESLFSCNICPYVVLDGGCDISDKKLTTLKDRAREKIQTAHSLSVGGSGCVCPLLTREVFIQVLIKLRVPFVQCFSEADRDIMTLASHWNCPVLSSDSDFCIFDLKAGFCPLNSFQWRNVNTIKGTQGRYIPAKCFSLDALCRYFSNMNKDLLPLFAVLCGNDHVNLPVMDRLLSQVCLSLGAAGAKGRRHHRIVGLLSWLSRFAGPTEALDNVLKYLPKKDRDNVQELLCCSMEEYQLSHVKLQDFFQRGTYACPEALSLGVPEWVLVALAKGQLSPFVRDALVLKRTFLHTQVENMQQPNAHRASLPIRQVIYGLLSNGSAPLGSAPRNALPPRPPAFSEVERISKNIKISIVDAVDLPRDHSDLSELAELSSARRLTLLLETLKVKQTILDPIPPSLKLPIAVSCYWLQHSEVKAKLYHLQALLLGMLLGPLHAIINSPGKDLPKDGAKKLHEEFQRVKAQTRQSPRPDLDTAHLFCQWQSCLLMGLYLNQLLSTPLPEPDLTRLYSGSLVHGLCRHLLPPTSVERLLSMCPEAKQLYEHLFNATRSCAPAELFLPKGCIVRAEHKTMYPDAHNDLWDADTFSVEAPVQTVYACGTASGDRWEGEDEDVKDNWDDDDEGKKEAAEVKPEVKISEKKKITEKIKKEERQQKKRQEKIKKRLEEPEETKVLKPEEQLADKRLKKFQEEADLELAKETFGVTNTVFGIDAINPSSRDDFTEFGKLLKDKITQYEKSLYYASFLEALVRDVCISLENDDLKNITSSLTVLCSEKQKQEKKRKAKKKKKGVVPGGGLKATIKDDLTDYDGYHGGYV